jgi:hypothetical protein
MLMFFAKGYSVCQKSLKNKGFIFLNAGAAVISLQCISPPSLLA